MPAPSAGLIASLERRMTDTIRFTHTTVTPVDDAVDPNTYKPVPVAGETPSTVYEGKCLIFPRGNRLTNPSGAPVQIDAYDVLIPVTAAFPVTGDKGTILTTTDSTLVNAVVTVESCERSSIYGARVVHVRDLLPAKPIHG